MLNETFSWPLWPIHDNQPLPGHRVELEFEDPATAVRNRVIRDVFHPRVFAYSPRVPNGRAVLVLAGGGYTQLVIGKEGVEVAEWLASLGFHAFVLAHRFPCQRFGSQAPVDDTIEALRQIRSRAAELGIAALPVGEWPKLCERWWTRVFAEPSR